MTTNLARNLLNRRQLLKSAAIGVPSVAIAAAAAPGIRRAAAGEEPKRELQASRERGEAFLTELLDPQLDLLPEYRGANVYWLYHDNYLAAKVLAASQPALAQRITRAIRKLGVERSGKIEILFDEAPNPLPFHQYKLIEVKGAKGNNAKQLGDKLIKTEIVTDEVFKGWEDYADLLLLAAIAQANTDAEAKTDATAAKQHFDRATAMWDGHGFNDRVVQNAKQYAKQYATYKLALYLVAAARLKARPTIADAVLKTLLAQQADDGGWITDYDAEGKRLGLANVETTSLAILALEACVDQ